MKNTLVLGLCLLFGFQKPLIAENQEFNDQSTQFLASHPDEHNTQPLASHPDEYNTQPLASHSDEYNTHPLASHPDKIQSHTQPLALHPDKIQSHTQTLALHSDESQSNQSDTRHLFIPTTVHEDCSSASNQPSNFQVGCCAGCNQINNEIYDFASYDCGPFCDRTSYCYGDFWDQATAHDLVISADFLYWSTNYNLPSLVELSTTTTTVLNPDTQLINNTLDLVVSRAKKNWTPGFRVGLAWEPQSTCWDVKIIYTNFYNKESSNRTAPVSSILVNFNAKYHLNYNVGDFEIGQTFCIGDSFNLRPFCGVRLGFLKQNSNLALAEFTAPSTTATLGSPFQAHLLQKTWAAGPRIGFDGQWGNFYGVSILGHLSSALLYGEDNLKGNLDLLAIGSTTDFPISETLTNTQIRDSSYHLFPALQMFIGLGYETSFLEGYEMKIKAGWETNYWWGAANILLLERAISLQGFTLDLAFTF